MRVIERAGVAIALGQRRDDNLHDRVIEVVRVRALRFVVPNNDRAVVLVSLGGHDLRHYRRQKIISLFDVGIVSRQALITTGKRSVHVVELVGRNPVVLCDTVVRQIGLFR
jgi:hypothetical protein